MTARHKMTERHRNRYPKPPTRTYVTKLVYKDGSVDIYESSTATGSNEHANRIKDWIRVTDYRYARIRDVTQYVRVFTGDAT